MPSDAARLYQLLLNTGLQTKDNPLHQVLHDLIGHAINTNKQITVLSGIISGGGGVGPQGIQGIQGVSGINGLDGESLSSDDLILPVYSLQNLITPFTNGDILVAGLSGRIISIPDVILDSVLVSGGIGAVPLWTDNVNLGTSNSGFLNVIGKLAVTFNLADDGVFAQSVSATFPSVITATRTAIFYDIHTAGSSGFGQVGVTFQLDAGYTGSSTTIAHRSTNLVANPNNQAIAHKSQATGAGLSNCAISGIAGNATNGNIGVYGGIGAFSEGNFNFNITAAILGSNGATGNDIYRGYSSTTLKFSVTDAGNVVALGDAIFTGKLQAGATKIITWGTLAAMTSPADGQINLTKQATTIGIGLDVTTDAVLAIRNRAQNADAAITHAAYTHSGAEIDKTYQVYTPLTGATITMSAGQSRAIVNPAGLIAALTITLPSSPVDGQIAGFSFTQAVTVLTVNAPGGATVVASPTSAAIDTSFRFLYQASSTTWFPAS